MEDKAGDAGWEKECKVIMKVKGAVVLCTSVDRLAFDRSRRRPEGRTRAGHRDEWIEARVMETWGTCHL